MNNEQKLQAVIKVQIVQQQHKAEIIYLPEYFQTDIMRLCTIDNKHDYRYDISILHSFSSIKYVPLK